MGERDRQPQDSGATESEEQPTPPMDPESLANLLGDDYVTKMETPPWRQREDLDKDRDK